ncbi:hypothetical protein HYH03_011822 [Edaphochlamys debaryana]|uniref:Uncharacterized protein n=1 Tax=Edaphochlamys debaryana TaxID=47281 RepID=A0A836BUS7_9CHLO|nr:hypothetical protein HYH03_011822 [Edaphochlamys debaryana]|eukprot:KAG2489715.1 hypothetical protein HYH03_011822 [Edaphochlamys debaryana]
MLARTATAHTAAMASRSLRLLHSRAVCAPATFSHARQLVRLQQLSLAPVQRERQSAPGQRGFAAAAAAAGGAAGPGLVDRIKSDMKDAMKAKDQVRLDAIRFLSAAIKQREIDMRESGGAMSDDEVIKVIQKLVKQRKDSIESYKSGGRDDLVAKEQAELGLLEAYLPAMMSREEVEALVLQVIAELGASGPKAMGPVMKAVTARSGGRADNKAISDVAKAKLQPPK